VQDTSSVSYAAMAFFRSGAPVPSLAPRQAPPRLEDAPADSLPLGPDAGGRLVRLARAALQTRLGTTNTLDDALRDWPRGRDEELRRGVFVTLNRTDPAEIARDGRLRGCIGQPEPTWPLYYGTVQAALDAALRDPRFPAVTAAELPRLAVEVTVLSPRRKIASYRDIRIGTHGVVLQKGGRSALFLPQVAPEQGWSVEQMLSALSEKAGLPGDAWREGARLEVFTGQVFEEEP
jgi:AmmeMemoRadiSam system protein A